MQLHGRTVEDLEIDGVDPRDYPDFSDAYIASARWADTGEPLGDQELDLLNEQYPEVVGELAYEQCVGRCG